jgi:hypothetical protein
VKIKLPTRAMDDFHCLKYGENRGFTVRSEYNLALKLISTWITQASSSAPDGDHKLWTCVPHMRRESPPKVNVFAWTLRRDVLPTRRNKFRRRCDIYDCCPIYNREPESSWHAAVPCPQAAGLILAMRNHLLLPDKGRGTIRLHWTWLAVLLLENSTRV